MSENAESERAEYPFDGTCDSCAQGDRLLRPASEKYPDAWICAECIDFHERAVDAALAEAWGDLNSSMQEATTRERFRRTIAAAITAYFEHQAEDAQIDGSGVSA